MVVRSKELEIKRIQDPLYKKESMEAEPGYANLVFAVIQKEMAEEDKISI